MKGYELTFKGKTISLPYEAITTITKLNDEPPGLHVGLYDNKTDNTFNWLREELKEGDEIIIEQKEIKEVSEAAEVYNFYEYMGTTKEKSDQAALERYLTIKKELEEKGLIDNQ